MMEKGKKIKRKEHRQNIVLFFPLSFPMLENRAFQVMERGRKEEGRKRFLQRCVRRRTTRDG